MLRLGYLVASARYAESCNKRSRAQSLWLESQALFTEILTGLGEQEGVHAHSSHRSGHFTRPESLKKPPGSFGRVFASRFRCVAAAKRANGFVCAAGSLRCVVGDWEDFAMKSRRRPEFCYSPHLIETRTRDEDAPKKAIVVVAV